MTDLMFNFYEKIKLSAVICEKCSKLSCKTSEANFEQKKSVIEPPMQIIIFLQRSEYNL